MIAFDPSYVRKAGKHTPGFGYYWWGVAGAAKWGLEIAGIAAVDLNTRTAYHLEAVQSPAHTPAGDTPLRIMPICWWVEKSSFFRFQKIWWPTHLFQNMASYLN